MSDLHVFMPTGFDIPTIECASPLGMENGQIKDSAIVASSRYNQYWGPERGRLNEKPEGKMFNNNLLLKNNNNNNNKTNKSSSLNMSNSNSAFN